MQVLLGNPQTQLYKSQFGRNASSFTENLNFSTQKCSQVLEVWVRILNFSNMTCINIVLPVKIDFFLYKRCLVSADQN